MQNPVHVYNSYSIFSSSLNLLENFYNAIQEMFHHLKCSWFELSTDKKSDLFLKYVLMNILFEELDGFTLLFKKKIFMLRQWEMQAQIMLSEKFFTIHCSDF